MQRFYETAKISEYYLKFRPPYCKKLVTLVTNFHRNQQNNNFPLNKLDLVVDVGCGNGQSSGIFQSYFKQIVGVDVSAEQIKQAKRQNVHKHIQYIEGCAEKLPLKDKCADLIISGEAAHWFDLPKFFSECKRVLKPNGCIAIFGYWVPKLTPIDNKCEILSAKGTELAEKSMLKGVSDDLAEKNAYIQLKQRYQDIFDMIPFEVKQRIDNIIQVNKYSMNEICGLMRSTDSYHSYMDDVVQDLRRKHGKVTQRDLDSNDMAIQFSEDLEKLWNLEIKSDDEKIMTVDFDYFLLLAKP